MSYYSIYHPDGKCTGAALKLRMTPSNGRLGGIMVLRLANQITIGRKIGDKEINPTFDWKLPFTISFGVPDITKMLRVMRGEIDSVNEGEGLTHVSMLYVTRILFRKLKESETGYCLEVYRSKRDGVKVGSCQIVLSNEEILALRLAIEGYMPFLYFGMPANDEDGYRDDASTDTY